MLMSALAILAIASCEDEGSISASDKQTVSKASDLGKAFIEEYVVFTDALIDGDFSAAQRTVDRMREVSNSRLGLVSTLENEELREFHVGLQGLNTEGLVLYQRILDAVERGASDRELRKLEKEEIGLAEESREYVRREGKRLLGFDDEGIREGIRKQIELEESLYRGKN